MIDKVNEWSEGLGNFINKVGFSTFIVLVGIGFFSGLIPSPLSVMLERIAVTVQQNQVLSSGLYYYRLADCLKDAVKSAGQEGWMLTRLESHCREADTRMVRHMQTLGIQMIGKGE